MPLFHCVKCHHEWEGYGKGLTPICDWCGAHGFIIEEKTSMELMMDEMEKVDYNIEKFLNIPKRIKDKNPFSLEMLLSVYKRRKEYHRGN